jgi:hypothetical protein
MVTQSSAEPPLAQFFISSPGRSYVWEYKMAVYDWVVVWRYRSVFL